MLGIDKQAARVTWTSALVILLLAALYAAREAFLVFTIALLLAYLLYPLMDGIDRYLPTRTRTAALSITYLLLVGVFVTFGIFLGSVAAEQATNLAKAAPGLIEKIHQDPGPGPQAVKSLKVQITGAIEGQLRQHYNEIVSGVPRVSLRVLAASGNLLYLIIIPILSFFILRDGRSIRDSFLSMFDEHRAAADEILMDIHKLLLQYMRALLFLCCAAFIVYSIVLSSMGVPYSILLASIAFPLEFIPLVGPLVSAGLILLVSLAAGFPHVLWVFIFLGIYRILQDYVISPRLMSEGVELHPLLVIFGVFAGGEIGGVAGIFLSVPTLALIRLLYHRLGLIRANRRIRATTDA